MKILLTLFVLFFSSALIAEVYYCVGENNTGFRYEENFLNQTTFKNQKFVADINFEKKTLISDDLLIRTDYGHTCVIDHPYTEMQCINGWGTSFIIDKITLRFVWHKGLGYVTDEDGSDISLHYGQCQVFK